MAADRERFRRSLECQPALAAWIPFRRAEQLELDEQGAVQSIEERLAQQCLPLVQAAPRRQRGGQVPELDQRVVLHRFDPDDFGKPADL